MQNLTQINIRFDAATGSFASASITDPTGTREASVADVIAEVPDINTAALARIAELERNHAAEIAALTAERDELATLRATMESSVTGILQMEDTQAKFDAMEALGRSFVTPAREKAAQALAQEIAAKQAELDALTAKEN